MSALADVQRALNAIRSITSEEQAAVRLEVLRLMATMIADEARDIEGVKAKTASQSVASRCQRCPYPSLQTHQSQPKQRQHSKCHSKTSNL